MALPTQNMRLSSINATFGVSSSKYIFRNQDGSLKTEAEFANIITGTLSSYCPGSTQALKRSNLLTDRKLSYFKGYYDDSKCNFWDIECYANTDQTLNLTYQVEDITISNDGEHFYELTTNSVKYHKITSPNNLFVRTLEYTLDISAKTTTAKGMYLTKDGTKLFIVEYYGKFYQYNLSVPFDLSTASYYIYTDLNAYNDGTTMITGIEYADDGLTAYFTKDFSNNYTELKKFTFGASFLASSVNGNSWVLMPTTGRLHRGVRFNEDGSSIYRKQTDVPFSIIFQYPLTTNFDANSYDGTYNQLGVEDYTNGFCFSGNGYYLFICVYNGADSKIRRIKHNLI